MMPLLQTILAARNNRQDSPWTQLLVIIAIAAVYGFKVLIKAKKSFTEEQEPDEPPMPQQQPAGQTPVMTRQAMPAFAQR